MKNIPRIKKIKILTYTAVVGVCVFGWNALLYAQVEDVSTSSPTGETQQNIESDGDSGSTTLSEETQYAPETLSSILSGGSGQEKKDLTKPEELPEKVAIVERFASRPIDSPSVFSFFGYWVQQAVLLGIPANTIVLILFMPIIAMFVTFVRVILGLPTLELLVPIALVYAFVAVGVFLGLAITVAVIAASYVSRIILQKVPIMFFPKRSISLFLLSIFTFAALTIFAGFDFETISNVSIFPVLILTLLGDSIVSVQLYKSFNETFTITFTTFVIGIVGFLLATAQGIQSFILLYPEVILLTLPANILMGRYFGLRVSELLRFNILRGYAGE